MALMSNILVGSSSNNRSGRENSARANASRILQPPEKVFVARTCMSLLKPKPLRITEARAGALSASIFSSAAYTSVNSLFNDRSVDPALIFAAMSFSNANRRVRSKSHSSTLSNAIVSTSSSTHFLFDVQNWYVRWNLQLFARNHSQQCRFTKPIATHQTVSSAARQQ